jgi:DNA-binding response OmpR family regulator
LAQAIGGFLSRELSVERLSWLAYSDFGMEGTMANHKRILVIEDDAELAGLLRLQLELSGYQARVAHRAVDSARVVSDWKPDLVLLDIMMIGQPMDGWEACRSIRAVSDVPIIFITALGSEEDKVRGLNMGADDYLAKPFGANELKARVEAVLRRRQPVEPQQHVYVNGDLAVNWDTRRVLVHGQDARLTPLEFKLLSVFVEREGQTLTHEYIIDAVWGPEAAQWKMDRNHLKFVIFKVRRKIERDPSQPEYLVSHAYDGYELTKADSRLERQQSRGRRAKKNLTS